MAGFFLSVAEHCRGPPARMDVELFDDEPDSSISESDCAQGEQEKTPNDGVDRGSVRCCAVKRELPAI